MKLEDLRRKLKAGDKVLEAGRHITGPSFVPVSEGEFTGPEGRFVLGVDVAAPGSPEHSVYTTMRKNKDGSVTLVSSGRIHRLHEFDGPNATTCDDLCDELIYPLRVGDYTPHRLGPSFAHRYLASTPTSVLVRAGAFWPEEGISALDLGQVMLPRDEARGAMRGIWPGGRVNRTRVLPGADGRIIGAPIRDEPEDYMVFIDTAFRQPMLFRYVGSGLQSDKPVIYARGDNSSSIHVGSAFCFYPAETVPCRPCEETGKVPEPSKRGAAFPPSLPAGGWCPFCYGLTRIWKAAPFKLPEARPSTVTTFADANPKKWRAAGSY